MVCAECMACKKFQTNDCSGAAEFTEDGCRKAVESRKNEIDISGCS
jgi:hypothetical protein